MGGRCLRVIFDENNEDAVNRSINFLEESGVTITSKIMYRFKGSGPNRSCYHNASLK